jgi:hypothetical protein
MNDTLRRFLREIAGKVDTERVVEVHLFQPLRHDGRETGVAVVAVTPPPVPDAGEEGFHADAAAVDATTVSNLGDDEVGMPDAEDAPGEETPDAGHSGSRNRLIVYRAMYRHTLKGPDRGKWELELVAEADAPLLAVDDVVRGVHRRTGEEVAPERLTGDAFRAALHEEPWSASAR